MMLVQDVGQEPRRGRDEGREGVGSVRLDEPERMAPPDDSRLRTMVHEHLDFTWRSLRRLGLGADVADDATQRVFLIASRKLTSIKAGSERAFLFNTALRVASSEKRSFARRREVLTGDDDVDLPDLAPGAEEVVDRQRARDLLERLLLGMALDLRAVFILFELEGLTTAEIAATLELPMGTAASRLRRAREAFQDALKRHQARVPAGGTS